MTLPTQSTPVCDSPIFGMQDPYRAHIVAISSRKDTSRDILHMNGHTVLKLGGSVVSKYHDSQKVKGQGHKVV